ncbi:MAG: hypothetical protein ABSF45_11955 [Terriglobia bacterium]
MPFTDTIARKVEAGLLGYVGKPAIGDYQPFFFACSLSPQDVEIFDDMSIVSRDTAASYEKLKEKPPVLTSLVKSPMNVQMQPGKMQAFVVTGVDKYAGRHFRRTVEWKAAGGSTVNAGVLLLGMTKVISSSRQPRA